MHISHGWKKIKKECNENFKKNHPTHTRNKKKNSEKKIQFLRSPDEQTGEEKNCYLKNKSLEGIIYYCMITKCKLQLGCSSFSSRKL